MVRKLLALDLRLFYALILLLGFGSVNVLAMLSLYCVTHISSTNHSSLQVVLLIISALCVMLIVTGAVMLINLIQLSVQPTIWHYCNVIEILGILTCCVSLLVAEFGSLVYPNGNFGLFIGTLIAYLIGIIPIAISSLLALMAIIFDRATIE